MHKIKQPRFLLLPFHTHTYRPELKCSHLKGFTVERQVIKKKIYCNSIHMQAWLSPPPILPLCLLRAPWEYNTGFKAIAHRWAPTAGLPWFGEVHLIIFNPCLVISPRTQGRERGNESTLCELGCRSHKSNSAPIIQFLNISFLIMKNLWIPACGSPRPKLALKYSCTASRYLGKTNQQHRTRCIPAQNITAHRREVDRGS